MIDHYENPRNVGKLNAKSKKVGTGLVGAPACGDVMKLQVGILKKILLICTIHEKLEVTRYVFCESICHGHLPKYFKN